MGLQGMQAAAQVSELEVPLHCRVAWLRKNYSYFEDEHREVLMGKLDALTNTSGKKVLKALALTVSFQAGTAATTCSKAPGKSLVVCHKVLKSVLQSSDCSKAHTFKSICSLCMYMLAGRVLSMLPRLQQLLVDELQQVTVTWFMQLVAKWRELAEQSRWDEFVAAMLQEHYDTVYTRAQLKYLTPSTSQAAQVQAASSPAKGLSPSSQHDVTSNGRTDSAHQQNRCMPEEMAVQSGEGASHGNGDVAQDSDGSNGDEIVEAAGALSHLFGGSRQKLLQQVNSKEAESTLRWHREPVQDMSDETYAALARKLLRQYDPAALVQGI